MAAMFEPATVVLFAGLGGVCIGVEQAYTDAGFRDRYVDLAVNHWDTAVAVHELNHPMTQHLRSDVWEVDPNSVLLGRKIAYLHLSPDCVDFSHAKGSAPKRKHIRALADVGLIWAGKRRPDVITLENVPEFQQWGPLLESGQPDAARRGEEFKRWVNDLRALGYVVDWRELRACDYGTPTTRKRLFIIARCDGKPIVWPEKTHGRIEDSARSNQRGSTDQERSADNLRTNLLSGFGGNDAGKSRTPDFGGAEQHPKGNKRSGCDKSPRSLKPFHTAAECIDWSIPMFSIFATPVEAKAFSKQYGCGVPRRPLKPKTMARIAGGADKFILNAEKPFIVDIQNYGWNSTTTRDVAEPMPTVTSGPKGGGFAAVDAKLASPQPFVVRCAHGDDSAGGKRWGKSSHPITEPLPTVSGSKDFAAVDAKLSPFTIPRYGEAKGQSPRSSSVEQPLPTIVATDNGTSLVAAMLNRDFGQSLGAAVDVPAPTATGINHTSLVAATLSTLNHGGNEHRAADLRDPLATITGANDARALVAAMVTKFRGDSKGHAANEPMPTITGGGETARDAGAAHALGVSCAYMSNLYGTNAGSNGDLNKPAPTATGGGNHTGVISAYLSTYYGNSKDGHAADEPMPTIVGKDRIQLITTSAIQWPLTSDELKRAKMVGRFLIRELGEKVTKHLVWVRDTDRRKTFPLVRAMIDGHHRIIVDLLMRMLVPRELAKAQGFPTDYIIDRDSAGKPVSKADQVKLIGNSVCPQVAQAIAKANVVDLRVFEDCGLEGVA
jgi:DNA (cytosine-5)-methyltransferase 1